MADVSKIEIESGTYDIKDSVARTSTTTNKKSIDDLNYVVDIKEAIKNGMITDNAVIQNQGVSKLYKHGVNIHMRVQLKKDVAYYESLVIAKIDISSYNKNFENCTGIISSSQSPYILGSSSFLSNGQLQINIDHVNLSTNEYVDIYI